MTELECKKYEASAKLDLPADERAWVMEQASAWEERFAALDAIDTTGVQPLVTVSGLKNVLREDEARQLLPREEILAGAPEQYDGYFQAPKIVE